MTFQCQRCNRTGRYPLTARSHMYVGHRCDYCGSPHSVKLGETPTPIGPGLQPITARYLRLSPWHDARYRPYRTGWFECEFRGGLRTTLYWNGRAWTWCGQLVDTNDHYKWRGRWDD